MSRTPRPAPGCGRTGQAGRLLVLLALLAAVFTAWTAPGEDGREAHFAQPASAAAPSSAATAALGDGSCDRYEDTCAGSLAARPKTHPDVGRDRPGSPSHPPAALPSAAAVHHVAAPPPQAFSSPGAATFHDGDVPRGRGPPLPSGN